MARTPSNMLPLGTLAPDFSLPDTVSGEMITLSEQPMSPATVIMFICNHCPFVIFVNDELVRLANEYQEKGVLFFAISSNDVENYPEDSPEKMTEHAKEVKRVLQPVNVQAEEHLDHQRLQQQGFKKRSNLDCVASNLRLMCLAVY